MCISFFKQELLVFQVVGHPDFKATSVVTDFYTEDEHTLYIYPHHWPDKRLRIFNGARTTEGQLLATVDRIYDTCHKPPSKVLTVQPGVDVGLCVLLYTAYHKFLSEDGRGK